MKLMNVSISNGLYNFFMKEPLNSDVSSFDEGATLEDRYTSMQIIVTDIIVNTGFTASVVGLITAFFNHEIITSITIWLLAFFALPIVLTGLYLSIRFLPLGFEFNRRKKEDSLNYVVVKKSHNFYNFDYVVGISLGYVLSTAFYLYFIVGGN